jgi:hypothetical protein
MAYIGTSPSNGVRRRFVYEATASQTSFSGNDENGVTLTYVDSLYLDVYQNGIKLKAGDDYTATTGTTVVLVQGASANDVVEMVAFDIFSVGDTVSAKDGGNFAGNVAMAGTLGVTGDITLSNIAGGAVFNEAGADVDFRVESDTVDHALFVDGANGNVGISTSSPRATLDLGSGSGDGTLSNTASNYQLILEANASTTGDIGRGIGWATGANTVSAAINSYDAGTGVSNGLMFATAAAGTLAEAMRITQLGTISFHGITGRATGSTGHMSISEQANNRSYVEMATTSTSSMNLVVFFNPNGAVGSISTSGSATTYSTSSDYRLKENVVTDWDATTRLKQLKPSRFNFIADADTTVDGFLAHEVQAIVPEAITGTKDEVEVWQDGEELPDGVSVGDNKLDDDGNTIPVMQGIDQSKLVPLLVKTIQELEARITALENA